MARTSTSSKSAAIVGPTIIPEIVVDTNDVVRDTEEQRVLDQRLVRGKFEFYERPGGTLNFTYRRYKGEKIVNYILRDKGYYELPWGVVRALEEGSHYYTHNIETDETDDTTFRNGERQVHTTKKGAARYSFRPEAFGFSA